MSRFVFALWARLNGGSKPHVYVTPPSKWEGCR